MLELKALDVKILDVRSLTDVTDYMILATGESHRHLKAMATAADELLKRLGRTPIGREGDERSGWMVVDAGDAVIHVFSRALRKFYDLDGLWADAPLVEVPEAKP